MVRAPRINRGEIAQRELAFHFCFVFGRLEKMVRAKRLGRGEGEVVVESYKVPVKVLLRDSCIPNCLHFESHNAFLHPVVTNSCRSIVTNV